VANALILASASPRRLDLLRQIGIEPELVVSMDIDESERKDELPRKLAERLALEKAAAAKAKFSGKFILTADTVVAVGRRILPKAETPAQVSHCLKLLSGRRHHVYTAVAIVAPDGTVRSRIGETAVILKRLTAAEHDAYVACGEGIGKAGGYMIQGQLAKYVKAISGAEPTVVGLPVHDVYQMLTGMGFFTHG
jgi:septum formation protein